jgi:hypothetical protein
MNDNKVLQSVACNAPPAVVWQAYRMCTSYILLLRWKKNCVAMQRCCDRTFTSFPELYGRYREKVAGCEDPAQYTVQEMSEMPEMLYRQVFHTICINHFWHSNNRLVWHGNHFPINPELMSE